MRRATGDVSERAERVGNILTTVALFLVLLTALFSRNEEEIAKALWLLGGWLFISRGIIRSSLKRTGLFLVLWLGGYIVGLPYAFHGRVTGKDMRPLALGGLWVLLIVALTILGTTAWTLWSRPRNPDT